MLVSLVMTYGYFAEIVYFLGASPLKLLFLKSPIFDAVCREISLRGEGPLTLVQLPINFKLTCFEKHYLNFLFSNTQA